MAEILQQLGQVRNLLKWKIQDYPMVHIAFLDMPWPFSNHCLSVDFNQPLIIALYDNTDCALSYGANISR